MNRWNGPGRRGEWRGPPSRKTRDRRHPDPFRRLWRYLRGAPL